MERSAADMCGLDQAIAVNAEATPEFNVVARWLEVLLASASPESRADQHRTFVPSATRPRGARPRRDIEGARAHNRDPPAAPPHRGVLVHRNRQAIIVSGLDSGPARPTNLFTNHLHLRGHSIGEGSNRGSVPPPSLVLQPFLSRHSAIENPRFPAGFGQRPDCRSGAGGESEGLRGRPARDEAGTRL